MPVVNVNNCDYYYEIHGYGKEILIFLHGILLSSNIFYNQLEKFKSKYTIITFDFRGHGLSEITDNGYQIENLLEDSIQLLKHLNIKQAHFISMSMGTDVAMRLAIEQPNLAKSLTLMGASASASPETNSIKYSLLKNIIKFAGVNTVIEPILSNLFGNKFINDSNRKDELQKIKKEILSNKKTIYKAISSAINRNIIKKSKLKTIICPTLILVGTEDKATSPEKSEYLHENIKNSTLKYIEDCGHPVCVEDFKACNTEIELFLDKFDT